MKKGFSLIELLISLIVISCIATILVPVISKKLHKNTTSIASKITTLCPSDCSLCYINKGEKKCLICSKNCSKGYYLEQDSCSCKSCSSKFSNCESCSFSSCINCKTGYGYQNSNSCTKCPSNTYSKENSCLSCEKGTYCESGEKISCLKFDPLCASCTSSGCSSCPEGYYLSSGKCVVLDCTIYGKDCSLCNASTGCLKNGCNGENKLYTDTNSKNYCAIDLSNTVDVWKYYNKGFLSLVSRGTKCASDKCCWRINNTFVCNYAAAKALCEAEGLMLPNYEQAYSLTDNDAWGGAGAKYNINKLIINQSNLCYPSKSGCEADYNTGCIGLTGDSSGWGCFVSSIWVVGGWRLNAVYINSAPAFSFDRAYDYTNSGFSVRCVKGY